MKKNLNWNRAIIWSSVSFLFIVVILLNPVQDAGYAGARFAYNFTFFFPILIIITIASIVGFIFTIKYLKRDFKNDNKYRLVKLLTPFFLLLPAIFQILSFVVTMTMMSYSISHPKDYEPEFTSRKIGFNNDRDVIYIHGSLYGQYRMKRTLYISNDSAPIFSPDTSANYFYNGENDLALFYSSKQNTLFVYLPIGFKVGHKVKFKSKIIVEQIECDEDSIYKLREMYNAGQIDEFFWLTNEQQNR